MSRIFKFIATGICMTAIWACGPKESEQQTKLQALEKEAYMAMSTRDYATAEQKYLAALQLDPDNQSMKNNLAILYVQFLNQPGKAKVLWKEMLEKWPQNSAYMNNLAGIYLSEKNYDEAIKLYEQAKTANTKYHMPYYNIGSIYMEQQKYGEAVEEFKKGLQTAPRDSHLIVSLCSAMIFSGSPEDAYELLKRKYRELESIRSVASNLSRISMQLGKLDEAENVIQAYIENYPDDATFLAEQIELAFVQGKPAQEIEQLLEKIVPNLNAQMKEWYPVLIRAHLSILKDDTDAALEQLKALDGMIPNQWIYFEGIRQHLLGTIYTARGMTDDAAGAMQKARMLAPFRFAALKTPDRPAAG